MVFDADALHVLSADIQDAVDFRVKESGRIVVGDGLDLSFVQKEGCLEQGFTVACGAAADNFRVPGQQAVDLRHGRNRSPDRAAVIIAVKRVKEGAVLADQGKLGGRGAGIDSQEAVSVVIGEVRALYAGLLMAAAEFIVLLLRGEKRIHAPDLELHVQLSGETLRHFGEENRIVLMSVHGAAHGGEKMGVVHIDGVLVVQIQSAHEGSLQFRQEVKGAAQESDVSADGFSAGKSADGLIDNRLEN